MHLKSYPGVPATIFELLELLLISNKKKTKVTFLPIIETEDATHQKMTKN